MKFAAILNAEAREMDAAGVNVIQFDEPAFNVYLDEVRDWGIAALEKAAAGLNARPPCTSATATASRPTSIGRKRLARNGGKHEATFPCSPNQRSARSRSSARIPRCRSSSWAC